MLHDDLKSEIEAQALSQKDEHMLIHALQHFSDAEQDELVRIARTVDTFWIGFVTQLKLLQKKVGVGAADSINSDIKQLIDTLKK